MGIPFNEDILKEIYRSEENQHYNKYNILRKEKIDEENISYVLADCSLLSRMHRLL